MAEPPLNGVAETEYTKKLLFPQRGDGVYFSLTKSTKSQKEESINSCLGDADTHAARMCQFLF